VAYTVDSVNFSTPNFAGSPVATPRAFQTIASTVRRLTTADILARRRTGRGRLHRPGPGRYTGRQQLRQPVDWGWESFRPLSTGTRHPDAIAPELPNPPQTSPIILPLPRPTREQCTVLIPDQLRPRE